MEREVRMELSTGKIRLVLNEDTDDVTIQAGDALWKTKSDRRPCFFADEGTFLFRDADKVCHERFTNGAGEGIRTLYEGFRISGPSGEGRSRVCPYSFETIYFVEKTTGNLYCEWIPIREEGLKVRKVFFPSPFEFSSPEKKTSGVSGSEERSGKAPSGTEDAGRKSSECPEFSDFPSWYTVLPIRQGLLIPNGWQTELKDIPFGGQYLTAGSYMPWFGQIKEGAGYIAVSTTPWDGGYRAEHPAGAFFTEVSQWLIPSMGTMRYPRILRYSFLNRCDYNDLCKIYREYVREQGNLRTLQEKAVQNPGVDELIQCSFVHTGIKTMVQPDSEFYDPKAPDKNNHLTTFAARAEQIRKLHAAGAGKIYLHLDGWAQPGYDNRHPDYYPVCEEAGGPSGMRDLVNSLHESGDLFGVHDQYRDYYKSAPSYSDEWACMQEDGSVYSHRRWAGGPQSYLCSEQAPFYVRRNFGALMEEGIRPDCAYLDVFTCNEADECFNPEHPVSRRECLANRSRCFAYLLAHDILTSSEEVSDYAVPNLIFCHYAPYEFMMDAPGAAREGIPVPLFNLVYHDCVIEPWMMEKNEGGEDYMLYALLNGGAPYLLRDAAYPGIDGAFEGAEMCDEERAARCRVVSDFYMHVAKKELIRHEFPGGDLRVQRSVFADGTAVTVDFRTNTYHFERKG